MNSLSDNAGINAELKKVCTQCQKEKSLNDFHAHKRSPDGRKSYCKECHKNKYKNYQSPSEIKRKEDHQRQRNDLIAMLQAQSHKECTKCKQVKEKNKDNFKTRKESKDGFDTICRSCVNERKLNLQRSRGVKPKPPNLRDAKILESYVGVIDGAEDVLAKGVCFLGSLCINNHQWEGTPYSLRKKNGGGCAQCSLETNRKLRSEEDYKEKERYLAWLKNPRISPSIAELVARSEQWARVNRKYLFLPPEEREEYDRIQREKYKRRYQNNPDKEKTRAKVYKHANPDKVSKWGDNRRQKVAEQSDGSITASHIKKILNETKKCPYCSTKLMPSTATIDHLVPISLGGSHSAYNVVPCCSSCNTRKSAKPFYEWLNELDDKHQKSARNLYTKLYGAPPEQQTLSLTF